MCSVLSMLHKKNPNFVDKPMNCGQDLGRTLDASILPCGEAYGHVSYSL